MTCPSGPTQSAAKNVINIPGNSLNPESFIPIKEGEPLSTGCERFGEVGSIPEVIRYPSYTLVNGVVATSVVSSGGIVNPAAFFLNKSGCYTNDNAQLASNCC